MSDAQELATLRDQVDALLRDNRALLLRVNDLEDRVENHAGSDATIIGPNYAHPNQAVSTVEFGDDNGAPVGREDSFGLTLLNSAATVLASGGPVVKWRAAFPTDGTAGINATDSFAYIGASVVPGTRTTGVWRVYEQTQGAEANIEMITNSNGRTQLVFTWETLAAGQLSMYLMSRSLAADTLQLTWDTGVILCLNNGGRTSDPTVTGDGDLFYRSDTDKFRGRANSVTENFAFESWVTAAAAPIGSAYVTIGSDATLTAERALTAGAGITITDGGAGSTVTVLVTDGSITYAKLQDISATQRVLGRNTAGAGDAEEVSASGVLDWIGSTRGSVLYRGASGWAILTPGTSGYVLQSNGAGADPSWAAAAAGGAETAHPFLLMGA